MKEDKNIWELKRDSTAQQSSPTAITSMQQSKVYIDINIRRLLSVWPFMLLFALLGWWAGKVYLRYVNPVYAVSTSVNIQQQQEIAIGQALYGSARDPFNDQMAYMKSPALALKLVDTLGLQYVSWAQGRFKNKDCYGLINWRILNPHTRKASFTIIPHQAYFIINNLQIKAKAYWGVPFSFGGYSIIINKLDAKLAATPINCVEKDRVETAFGVAKGIAVSAAKESNILTLTYADISSTRAIDILNALVYQYNQVLQQDKTKTFAQAIDFIEKRMGPLAQELDSIETSLAHYKSGRGFIGTSANGALYQDKMKDYDNELVKINILKSTITAVEKFIANPNLKDENLALVGITDGYLQGLLNQYQQLRSEQSKLDLIATENFPNKQLIDKQLSELRNNLFTQVKNYKNNLAIAENSYNQKMQEANVLLKNTPHEEKELIDKFRIQNIKEALFLTLLQKREEAAVAQASVTVNTKILWPAIKQMATEKPNKTQIAYSTALAGLFLPLLFALMKELLKKQLISKKQLQNMTAIPVIAELEENKTIVGSPFAVALRERSMIGEQIRGLRTTLAFYQTNQKPVSYFMITSSMSGEGKSFLSLNLARSYALQGKRVALLEFDLRRPKMSKTLGIQQSRLGLSSLLVGKCTPEEIIQQPLAEDEAGFNNFHFFPAGLIPPNPQELVAGIYMETLKAYLDSHYDIVIIDTPPFGIVADAQILGSWADATLVVVRFNYTLLQQVNDINEWHQKGCFKNMSIVFNGIQNSGYYGYRYGNYYYKRKYGYQYYAHTQS